MTVAAANVILGTQYSTKASKPLQLMTGASKARKHVAATDYRVAAATVVLGTQYSAKQASRFN